MDQARTHNFLVRNEICPCRLSSNITALSILSTFNVSAKIKRCAACIVAISAFTCRLSFFSILAVQYSPSTDKPKTSIFCFVLSSSQPSWHLGFNFSAGPYIRRINDDAREDEMEDNMQAVGSMLGNLKNMAQDMGGEIERQNKQLDRINNKVWSLKLRYFTLHSMGYL